MGAVHDVGSRQATDEHAVTRTRLWETDSSATWMNRKKRVKRAAAGVARGGGTLRHELAGYLRDNSQVLQDRWVRQMKVHDLLRDTPLPELEAGFTALHNIFVDCLETGEYEAARSVAQPDGRGRITTDRIIDSLLALRDVYWRSLFEKYQADVELLAAALDLCFSVADRLLAPVVLSLGVEQATASQQEIRQLRMLVKTGMVLNAKLSLPAVLQRIANMACKLVGAQYGALGVVDGKAPGSRPGAAAPGAATPGPAPGGSRRPRPPSGQTTDAPRRRRSGSRPPPKSTRGHAPARPPPPPCRRSRRDSGRSPDDSVGRPTSIAGSLVCFAWAIVLSPSHSSAPSGKRSMVEPQAQRRPGAITIPGIGDHHPWNR